VVLVVSSQVGPGHETLLGRWELLGLASAVLSGAAVTAIRMARRTESSWSIFASFSFFGLLATLPVAIPTWQHPTPREWFYLTAVGVISIGAQLLLTSALRWIETVVAGVIAQFAVVVSMILGTILLEEHLSALALAGSALTIIGVVTVMAVTSRPQPSAFDEAVTP
jgi:drug/metabolite transporter (DMT)-like permease